MTGGAMSREAMLASLGDIRLPVGSVGDTVADLAAGIGLAALAALIVVAVLRAAGSKRTTVTAPTAAERRAEFAALPGEARRVAMLHLLKEVAPERHAALGARLYRPGGVATEEIEAELSRVA